MEQIKSTSMLWVSMVYCNQKLLRLERSIRLSGWKTLKSRKHSETQGNWWMWICEPYKSGWFLWSIYFWILRQTFRTKAPQILEMTVLRKRAGIKGCSGHSKCGLRCQPQSARMRWCSPRFIQARWTAMGSWSVLISLFAATMKHLLLTHSKRVSKHDTWPWAQKATWKYQL